MSPPRRTRKVYGVKKTPGHRFKCSSSGCHYSFVKYEKLEKHLQDIHLTTIQGIRHSQNVIQIQHNYDNNTFTSKIDEEKYLPLKNGNPHIEEKEKVTTLVKKLRKEIKILVNDLNKKNKMITELKEKYKNLNVKYLVLKKDHDSGDNHYTES
ncbi:25337_t:CDS:2 [Dentiscutata erythropus]|uniref:25337_t:CDS:1 n=1 Tax=Dentiscutata erythropus TaxID=1348616 RepID=A0A9N9D6P6_9GLOM|nr:25337_t:CDS:2 [Dentiscutata erythropus]